MLRLKRQGHAGFGIRIVQRRLTVAAKEGIYTNLLRVHLHGVVPVVGISLG